MVDLSIGTAKTCEYSCHSLTKLCLSRVLGSGNTAYAKANS